MQIIPAIDIIDGKCVRLTEGDYAQKTIYNENPLFQKQPFSQSQPQTESHENEMQTKASHKEMQKMHEKINYMIRILEDLKVEKTDNVMEEFIMFSLLGVFVIFVVDSFSKSAKYVR